ncbi:FAD-binding oxidoreductase [Neobacillus sp. OS1-32]|uniref:FAD-binding oxidoreductase n=1 Tax=Neobacillus sp. OS1-32 TaxID=3070682 RepID=UPI0027E069DD|nr:FAD-binding oxidoreductase [Neobacillus sp. OS1-32]WML31100.1 FAD-binding oxidoreductase [Neobacillus sp. OS1-32]
MVTAELMTDLCSLLPKEQIVSSHISDSALGNNGRITVFPKTEQEISSILQYANGRAMKVNIMGAGTKRGYGGITDSADLLMSLEKYHGIIDHSPGDTIVTVKAGTIYQDLQNYLTKHQQKVPLDPSLPAAATIGGVIAANDFGPKRLGYGSARDMVIGLRMVYPDGTIIRSGGKTVKNVAGYDMNKLYIGSMGTLGVISEITLKLRPLKQYESLILLSFPEGNHENILAFTINILDSTLEPVALEVINPALAEKLIGIPAYTLAISFEDVESSVHYQVDFVKRNKPESAALSIFEQNDAEKFWDSIATLAPNGRQSHTETITRAALKMGVKNLDVLQIIKDSHLLQDSHHLNVESHGGLGTGLCKVYLSGAQDDVVSAISTLQGVAQNLGGYAVVTHLPLALRQQMEVWGEKPTHFFLFDGIKAKVDPKRILNNGRFVGGI